MIRFRFEEADGVGLRMRAETRVWMKLLLAESRVESPKVRIAVML